MAYVLVGRRGNSVRFVPLHTGIIEKESESYSSSVTSNPVEDGADLTDHVNNDPGTLSISGTIVGGEYAIDALKDMRESRDILTYIGATRMSNLVFTSLKFDRTHKNNNGASFSATLKQIRTNMPEYVPSDEELSMLMQDAWKNDEPQLNQIINTGMITVAYQSVSSASAERYADAYKEISSSAPLTRQTGGYDGLSK